MEVIVVSHGMLAQAMLQTAEMIIGKQKDVRTFCLGAQDSTDLFRDQVEQAIVEGLTRGEVVVFSDLHAGSPFNSVVSLMQQHRFYHITAFNLAALIEVLSRRNVDTFGTIREDLFNDPRYAMEDVNQFVQELGILD